MVDCRESIGMSLDTDQIDLISFVTFNLLHLSHTNSIKSDKNLVDMQNNVESSQPEIELFIGEYVLIRRVSILTFGSQVHHYFLRQLACDKFRICILFKELCHCVLLTISATYSISKWIPGDQVLRSSL